MARVVLLVGGNLGNVPRTLQAAQQLINSRVGVVLRSSHRAESAPWGFVAAEKFSNQAHEISTDLTPHQVLDAVQTIEQELGRNHTAELSVRELSGARYTSRPIDIDILFYNDEVITTDRLTVPHPHLGEREFTLVLLNELMPQRRHPITGTTINEMLCALRSSVPKN